MPCLPMEYAESNLDIDGGDFVLGEDTDVRLLMLPMDLKDFF